MWQDAFSRIEPSFRFKSGMYLLRFKSGMYLLRFKSGMFPRTNVANACTGLLYNSTFYRVYGGT